MNISMGGRDLNISSGHRIGLASGCIATSTLGKKGCILSFVSSGKAGLGLKWKVIS